MTDKKIPPYLFHWSSKENRFSILKNGLIGKHNGKWGIYLSENPKSWETKGFDLYKISTRNLDIEQFYSVDTGIDEIIYWGKIKGKIQIPISEIELVKE